jgi:hypothetical protein
MSGLRRTSRPDRQWTVRSRKVTRWLRPRRRAGDENWLPQWVASITVRPFQMRTPRGRRCGRFAGTCHRSGSRTGKTKWDLSDLISYVQFVARPEKCSRTYNAGSEATSARPKNVLGAIRPAYRCAEVSVKLEMSSDLLAPCAASCVRVDQGHCTGIPRCAMFGGTSTARSASASPVQGDRSDQASRRRKYVQPAQDVKHAEVRIPSAPCR